MLKAMQVLTPRRARRLTPAAFASVLGSGFVGATLIVTGITLAWLVFATPVLRSFQAPLRASAGETAVGIVAWVVALVLPAACFVVGLVRLDSTTKSLAGLRPRRPLLAKFRHQLNNEYFVATDVELPDGRTVPEMVIGPHGVAVIEVAPPTHVTREVQGHWEVHLDTGWTPMENPQERVSRDADRVRRWFEAGDREYIIKVYAALIVTDTAVPRTANCAVITRQQAATWVTSLPPQRSLSTTRLEQIVALVKGT